MTQSFQNGRIKALADIQRLCNKNLYFDAGYEVGLKGGSKSENPKRLHPSGLKTDSQYEKDWDEGFEKGRAAKNK